MQILFADEDVKMHAISLKLMMQTYGERKARRMHQRLAELDAAHDLEVVRSLPALHCQQVSHQPECITICTLRPAGILFMVEDLTCFDGKILNWRRVTIVKIINLDENAYD
jgi:hypothetical protein